MSESLDIRPARPDDLEGLVRLWVEFMDYHTELDPHHVRSEGAERSWADYISGLVADDAWCVLVADLDRSLVGYAVATVQAYPPIVVQREYGFLQEIAVTESWRRRGIGRRLYRAAEAWLRSRAVPQIQVRVNWNNDASRAFWEREGYGPSVLTLAKRTEELE